MWKNGGGGGNGKGEPPCVSPAPSLFFVLFFSIHAYPTVSEPGTGYVIRDRLTRPQAFVKRAPTGNRLLFPVLARATQALQSTRFTHERSTSNIHRLVHSLISFFEKFSDSLKLGFYIRNTILVIRNFFCYIVIIIQTFRTELKS